MQRLVNFANLRITESNFPTLPKEQLREIVAEITKAIPDEDRVIALDRVLAFVDKSAIVPKDVPGLKADPPVIFFSSTPAVRRELRRRSDLESDRQERSDSSRSTPTGMCSSTSRPRLSTSATTTAG